MRLADLLASARHTYQHLNMSYQPTQAALIAHVLIPVSSVPACGKLSFEPLRNVGIEVFVNLLAN